MPLQSASDRILAAIASLVSRRALRPAAVELISDCLPNAAIGADVIAGFPRRKPMPSHAATLDFIAARPFTYLHVFFVLAAPRHQGSLITPANYPSTSLRLAPANFALSCTIPNPAAFRRSQIGRLTLRAPHPCGRDPADDPDSTPALSGNYLQVLLPVPLSTKSIRLCRHHARRGQASSRRARRMRIPCRQVGLTSNVLNGQIRQELSLFSAPLCGDLNVLCGKPGSYPSKITCAIACIRRMRNCSPRYSSPPQRGQQSSSLRPLNARLGRPPR